MVEGVYIRIDEGDYLKERTKIVRGDFICGDKFWAKGIRTKNKLKYE